MITQIENQTQKKQNLPVQSFLKTVSINIKIVVGVLRRRKSIHAATMLLTLNRDHIMVESLSNKDKPTIIKDHNGQMGEASLFP